MSQKILAFGASNSKKSINKQFATFAAKQLDHTTTTLLDLNDFEMPIYSIDREKESGVPDLAMQFKKYIKEADGIIISFAEHNGAYTAAFKNIMDWMSRIEGSTWESKPMFLLGTSPGKGGAKSVLKLATNSFKNWDKNSITSFSLPTFEKNFTAEKGILDKALADEFHTQLVHFTASLAKD